jgi:phosphatidylinositol dimannoside acyltransferase
VEAADLAIFNAYRAGSTLARALPGPVALLGSRWIGAVLGPTMRTRRAMVERHLRRVHGPGLRGLALQRAVQQTFDSYARYWVESFRLPDLGPDELDAGMTVYEGYEHIEAAIAGGHGAILCLPHLGGWDFGGAWLANRGYPITVVVEPLQPPELLEWFADLRRSLGLTVVPLGPAVGPVVIKALARNEVVALLCDRDLTGVGPEVRFFGERTRLPAGPATLGLRTGAPMLPTAVYFDGDRGHRGVVRPPIPAERQGRLRDDVARVTQALARELETLIRAEPSQWHLLQPNWPSDPGYGG